MVAEALAILRRCGDPSSLLRATAQGHVVDTEQTCQVVRQPCGRHAQAEILDESQEVHTTGPAPSPFGTGERMVPVAAPDQVCLLVQERSQ